MKLRLREIRKSKNIRRVDLAEAVNVTESTIGQYETGKIFPKLETANRIAIFLGVSIDDLIDREESEQKPGDMEATEEELKETEEELARLEQRRRELRAWKRQLEFEKNEGYIEKARSVIQSPNGYVLAGGGKLDAEEEERMIKAVAQAMREQEELL